MNQDLQEIIEKIKAINVSNQEKLNLKKGLALVSVRQLNIELNNIVLSLLNSVVDLQDKVKQLEDTIK